MKCFLSGLAQMTSLAYSSNVVRGQLILALFLFDNPLFKKGFVGVKPFNIWNGLFLCDFGISRRFYACASDRTCHRAVYSDEGSALFPGY